MHHTKGGGELVPFKYISDHFVSNYSLSSMMLSAKMLLKIG